MMRQMNMEQIVEQMLGVNADVNEQDIPTKSNPATAGQLKYINDLCEQKSVTFDASKAASFDGASNYIKELLAIKAHRPATDKQIKRIKEYCAALGINEPDYSKLDGNYGGSASVLIQQLSERAKNAPIPCSEKQYAMLLRMSLCPDCYEVAEVIGKETILKQEASDVISKHQNAYYTWIKSRLSNDQLSRIKQLHEMMETPFDYAGIIQLTQETASAYIAQLESEYNAAEYKKTTLEAEIEDLRGLKGEQDEVYDELKELVAKLYAAIGQDVEEDFFQTMDWDGLKDLCSFAKPFGADIAGMLEKCNCFNATQKAVLVGA